MEAAARHRLPPLARFHGGDYSGAMADEQRSGGMTAATATRNINPVDC
jgi:hypothetical protein